jgi:hypothetical protein
MAMTSETEIVPNSSAAAPADRTPTLADSARERRTELHGVTSFQEETTATWNFAKSSSLNPTALNIARAGDADVPSVTVALGLDAHEVAGGRLIASREVTRRR